MLKRACRQAKDWWINNQTTKRTSASLLASFFHLYQTQFLFTYGNSREYTYKQARFIDYFFLCSFWSWTEKEFLPLLPFRRRGEKSSHFAGVSSSMCLFSFNALRHTVCFARFFFLVRPSVWQLLFEKNTNALFRVVIFNRFAFQMRALFIFLPATIRSHTRTQSNLSIYFLFDLLATASVNFLLYSFPRIFFLLFAGDVLFKCKYQFFAFYNV